MFGPAEAMFNFWGLYLFIVVMCWAWAVYIEVMRIMINQRMLPRWARLAGDAAIWFFVIQILRWMSH